MRELIVDNFAGGGGASTGIELATGRNVDIAINHDPAAIAMHKVNHPQTMHYCESVWDVDPRVITKGCPVGLAWFSPDCKHFSKAKGGKPVEKGIRGLAWVAVRWAATVKPRVIMLENVEEFKTWGPLLKDGHPDPDKKGKTFKAFVNALKRQGYQVDWKELRACDYGAPTIRKRLFLVARCDGRPIVWPKPTHGDPKSDEVRKGKLKPWRTAAEIIDWSIKCPSIFNRKKPLSENTMRRIARGIQRFVIENPNPFIVRIGQTGFGGDRLQYSLDQPLTTITTKAEHLLISPTLIQMGYGDPEGRRVLNLNKSLGTITAGGNKFALATAFIARQFGTSTGHEITRPLGTVMPKGGGKSQLVTAFLTKYYGADIGQSVQHPLHTVTTKDRFGLVTIKGQDYKIVDIGMRMLEPHELFAAQGFPSDYIIDVDADGRKYSKSAQVARCGNAVPPPFAESLVRANLPELCTGSGRTLTLSKYHAENQLGQLAFNL
ncbi:modification methylase (plasmid) [Paenibacillus larvae subsp. larvae]|uniref:DNA (cytosine-5-)-methyltransferase n=3 Tax=Paenibacillus larvae TaxID=1464 RepID=A0A2L1UKC5_9BACL|nr:DNA cytosine methyltransferase [Paenibacillus larvae]AQT87040.1 DNA cytosine methyltransferase [Paenibacillus larvae subsp. pulvifaciens]AQZ49358.1 DNA cytosine methyltransferase [Paenibacillus larvae subsp. pulvifaciens]AVF29002.1 modification methylase [Paenibacillus larvae subsp. larvae]AVF33383.1 modification methylase [Paenibacillus larvae subsp. larvae]MBH0341155.1 DNA methyltransferase [Paenibacillus larvae]